MQQAQHELANFRRAYRRKIFHLNVRIQSERAKFHNSTQTISIFVPVGACNVRNSISSSQCYRKKCRQRERENIMKNSFRRMYNSFHTWNIYSIHADMTATTFFSSRWCFLLMRLEAIIILYEFFSVIFNHCVISHRHDRFS